MPQKLARLTGATNENTLVHLVSTLSTSKQVALQTTLGQKDNKTDPRFEQHCVITTITRPDQTKMVVKGLRDTRASHTRTVVRECCKGDDQSQWERGKFDPRHPKTPQPMVTRICVGDYVGDIYHYAKFYPNRFRGFGSAHA